MNDDVRRVLARDDLLRLAADADLAVGIVRQRESLARKVEDEPHLFALALTHQLAEAEHSARWVVRAQAWRYAGDIVRFCHLVDIPIDDRYPPEELYERAMRELDGSDLDRDLTLGVFHRFHAARNLRLAGDPDGALRLATLRPEDLYGAGADQYFAYFNYEVGAAYIQLGKAADVEGVLGEWAGHWATNARARTYPARHRVDLVLGLAAWATPGTDPRVARAHLVTARGRIPADEDCAVEELSATLALAEHLAGGEPTPPVVAEAVRHGRRALEIADAIRGRWRVVARSRAPLAVAFRRIYGDIALLAARLPGAAAAELGLRVALSAKQTGFASRIRAGLLLTGSLVSGLLEDIVALEDRPADSFAGSAAERRERLERLRFDLREAVSPMLADTVLPVAADVRTLLDDLGPRHALDYVELPDSIGGRDRWFRTLIRPDRSIVFERFTAGPRLASFIDDRVADARAASDRAACDRATDDHASDQRATGGRATGGRRELGTPTGRSGAVDWRLLAEDVLPGALLADLRGGTGPIELVISAHAALSLLPWAALVIDGQGTRLVQRALIAQSPVLTCVTHHRSPDVAGTALVRLVTVDDDGVDVERERAAWGLADGARRVPLHRCGVAATQTPVALADPLVTVLTSRRWEFLHIASHGAGSGLGQHLLLPEGPLSAGQALSMRWPVSVLMASCHVGQLVNPEDAEPLSFVTALLTGGSRCVVAGIDAVDDELTGTLASRMVRDIRTSGTPLDAALRNAQLAAIEDDPEETGWALLSAYTR